MLQQGHTAINRTRERSVSGVAGSGRTPLGPRGTLPTGRVPARWVALSSRTPDPRAHDQAGRGGVNL